MTAIPKSQKPDLVRLIDESHEQREEKPRPHMGCSTLGHHCERYLWLSFHWSVPEKFSGRMLRLFRRGHNEESTVVADLRAAGLHIKDTGSSQARVSFGNHVSGSIDGIIESGVPESPDAEHVLEIKTHSDKSFKELSAKGVQSAKPMHWAQMQVYMLGRKVARALYVAVNKNDDSLYIERVKINREAAEHLVARGHRIVSSARMPEPCINASPDWYQCKFCPAHKVCHQGEPVRQVNCRTCAHSTAENDGTWSCQRWGATIPTDHQYAGCDSHVIHPDMTPWQIDESASTENVAAWIIDGYTLLNGNPEDGENVFTTSELLANLEASKSGDKVLADIRKSFDARVIG